MARPKKGGWYFGKPHRNDYTHMTFVFCNNFYIIPCFSIDYLAQVVGSIILLLGQTVTLTCGLSV